MRRTDSNMIVRSLSAIVLLFALLTSCQACSTGNGSDGDESKPDVAEKKEKSRYPLFNVDTFFENYNKPLPLPKLKLRNIDSLVISVADYYRSDEINSKLFISRDSSFRFMRTEIDPAEEGLPDNYWILGGIRTKLVKTDMPASERNEIVRKTDSLIVTRSLPIVVSAIPSCYIISGPHPIVSFSIYYNDSAKTVYKERVPYFSYTGEMEVQYSQEFRDYFSLVDNPVVYTRYE